MSEDNVTKLDDVRVAFKDAKKHTPKSDKPKRGAKSGGGGPGDGGSAPPPSTFGRVWRLPNDSPVKALGHNGTEYHFLARSGQRTSLQAKELRGPVIVHLFGEELYLIKYWPSYDKNGVPTGDWKTGRLPGVLIATCQDVGLWDPADKERGVGCWAEDDGTLVFHCGDILATSNGRVGTGLRGRLLYPSAPRVLEPIMDAAPGKGAEFAQPGWGMKAWLEVPGPGGRVMERLVTWNFARPHVDAMLLLGEIGAMLLGAAPDWRPMCFLTGDSRTGKSTLLRFVKWLLGEGAYVSSGNGTQAAIARKVGTSSKPVILDELERKVDNSQAEKLIELMVLASSGETLDRGTPGTETNTFIARNCFLISAIQPPPLRPQDLNRLAIIELGSLDGAADGAQGEDDEDSEESAARVDPVLGSRADVERIGQQLRGRLLQGWGRYHKTFRGYFKELRKQGHDKRGADQFGALLTAYDLIMFNDADEPRAVAFAGMLPAKQMTETSGTVSNHEACLQYLLAATPGMFRGGALETVSWWMRQAKGVLELSGAPPEDNEAIRTLAKIGIKIFRDKAVLVGNEKPHWMVAISHESEGLARIYANSKWSKSSGTTAGWPQMFKRLDGAQTHTNGGGKLRIWIDYMRHYVTYVPWDTVFPAGDAEVRAIENETMQMRDRSEP